MVRIVPQFCRDEDVGAGDATLLDCCTDGGLGAVDASCVDVAIACFQRFGDGSLLSASILPGTEANGSCDYC